MSSGLRTITIIYVYLTDKVPEQSVGLFDTTVSKYGNNLTVRPYIRTITTAIRVIFIINE